MVTRERERQICSLEKNIEYDKRIEKKRKQGNERRRSRQYKEGRREDKDESVEQIR